MIAPTKGISNTQPARSEADRALGEIYEMLRRAAQRRQQETPTKLSPRVGVSMEEVPSAERSSI